MSYEAIVLTVQTLVQIFGLAGAGYTVARWQSQIQDASQSQHVHVHRGSFDEIEVEEGH